MTVCLVDTGIFCEIISVPNMVSDMHGIKRALQDKVMANEQLMLPMTTILETGNHIGQNGDGGARRLAASRFVKQVKSALEGESPFTATAFFERAKLGQWLEEFPDWACRVDSSGKGSGFGDLTIFKEWSELCEKFPSRRVYIWSRDAQLMSYDRRP